MYDDLVKRLREEASSWCINCCYRAGDCICAAPDDRKKDCDIYSKLQAAGAIDELSRENESLAKSVNEASEILRKRWISVTERLPEAESGDVSKPVLVTDGDCMAIAEWFNFELSGPFWSYTGFGDITHWQPLPQPPKEG